MAEFRGPAIAKLNVCGNQEEGVSEKEHDERKMSFGELVAEGAHAPGLVPTSS